MKDDDFELDLLGDGYASPSKIGEDIFFLSSVPFILFLSVVGCFALTELGRSGRYTFILRPADGALVVVASVFIIDGRGKPGIQNEE